MQVRITRSRLAGEPAAARARKVGSDIAFKKVNDEETRRALFPSNFPPAS